MKDIGFAVLEELDYNNVVALKIIEGNDLLTTLLVDEIKIPFNKLYELISSNELDRVDDEFIESIFDSNIKTDSKLIQRYKFLCQELNIPLTSSKPIIEEVIEETAEETPIEITKGKKPKVAKYPRRFGKQKINEQVAEQGGVPTLDQQTKMRFDDLKNLWVRMDKLLIKALHSEEHQLTNTEYLSLMSLVNIAENKCKPIFKRHANDPK